MPKGHSGKRSAIVRSTRLEAALEKAEKKIVARKTEKAVIFDDDGNVIFEKSGGKTSVNFTAEEAAKLSGKTLTHNHPGESRHTDFSTSDLRTAINRNIKEIRAVNEFSQVSFAIDKNSPLKINAAIKHEFLEGYRKTKEAMDAKLTAINAEWRKTIVSRPVTSEERQANSDKFNKVAEDMRNYLKINQRKYGYLYNERSLSNGQK